jgi:signal transduction histidine kinase
MYAAHELKTPLTSLKGFAKLALRAAEATGDKEIVEYLGAISQQINQVNRLASSLLDLSRIEHGIMTLETSRFDIVAFARSIARRYELSRPDFTFSLAFPASPTWVRADRQLIEQVLTHLIENGLKYSAGDRRIDIVMEVGEGVTVTSVRDYGIGIPIYQRDRIFDRFFRAANTAETAKSSLGVGLFIARDIISRHGGRIWLEQVTSPGCDFRFSLPVEP